MRAKALLTLAALASLPVLAACDVDARFVISGEDAVTFDMTYWFSWTDSGSDGSDADLCSWSVGGEETNSKLLRDPADPRHRGCHVTGQTTLAALAKQQGWGMGWLFHEGGQYHAFIPAELVRWSGMDPTGADPSITDHGTFHAEVTFPGPVIAQDASARVEGNTVIWDNRAARDLGGAWATSLEEGQLTASTWAQLAVVGGAAVGAAAMSAAWHVRSARRGRSTDDDDPTGSGAEGAALRDARDDTPATPQHVEDASVWAPGRTSTPSAPTGVPAPASSVPDHSEWAPDADR